MSDKRIDEVPQDTEVTGTEKIPISDASVAKFATTGQMKDYVLAQIAAIAAASGVDLSADGVYLLKGGAMKPISADVLATAILDYGFGKAAVASINGNEVVGVKDSATQKTITVGSLKSWLEEHLSITATLDVASMTSAGTISASSDLMVLSQGGTNKKITIATLAEWIHAAFKDFVAGLTAAESVQTSDYVWVVNGSTAKKCTIANLITAIGGGDVVAPSTTTSGNIPAWDNTSKKLTDGYGVAFQIASAASSAKIPTEAAVKACVDAAADLLVAKETGKSLSSNDYTTAEKEKLADLENAVEMVGATSTANGTAGLVPAPLIAERLMFLRGDGTWAEVVFDSDMTGATASANGVHGLVPAPLIAERLMFLRGDGTWADPADVVSTDMTGATATVNGAHGLVPAPLISERLKFLRGDGTWAEVVLAAMVGATSTANGTAGLVPAPLIADRNKFLKGDGTWGTNEITLQSAQATEGGAASFTNGQFGRIDAYTNSPTAFTINFDATSVQSRMYTVEMFVICGSTLPTTVSITVGGNSASVLYEGSNTSIVDMLEAGKAVALRFLIQYQDVIVCKTGTYTVSL